jgi:hypothetical protein
MSYAKLRPPFLDSVVIVRADTFWRYFEKGIREVQEHMCVILESEKDMSSLPPNDPPFSHDFADRSVPLDPPSQPCGYACSESDAA